MSTVLAQLPAPPAAAPDDRDTLYEVVNGQRVEVPPKGAFAMDLASGLASFLGQFTRRRVGRTVVEMLFLLDREADLQRRPDVAYVSYERWPRTRRVPSTPAWEVIPDLAVEVVSPTNTANEVVLKVRDYFRTGSRLVWVVYPAAEVVYVYTAPTAVRVIDRSGELDGGAVLPEFRLPLVELFEEEQLPDQPAVPAGPAVDR